MKQAGRPNAASLPRSFAGGAIASSRSHNPRSLDEARLLPRYRKQQPQLIISPDNGVNHIQTFAGTGQPRARTNDGVMVDPRDLRGVPIVGHSVAGVSPGTQPETETIRRITRQEGRAA